MLWSLIKRFFNGPTLRVKTYAPDAEILATCGAAPGMCLTPPCVWGRLWLDLQNRMQADHVGWDLDAKFGDLTFYLDPRPSLPTVSGDFARPIAHVSLLGRYIPADKAIVFASSSTGAPPDNWTIRHELMHVLSGRSDHPPKYFNLKYETELFSG